MKYSFGARTILSHICGDTKINLVLISEKKFLSIISKRYIDLLLETIASLV